MARALAGVGYDRAKMVAALHRHFPDSDAERLIDDATAWAEKLDASLGEGERLEAGAARDAEHDLTKTMHNPRRPRED